MRSYPYILFICCVTACLFFLKQEVLARDIPTEVESRLKNLFAEQDDVTITVYDDYPEGTDHSGQPSGLLEIKVGAKVFFASQDGRYLFSGPVFNTVTGQNISDAASQALRKLTLSQLPANMKLSFAATGQEKHTVTLFTDIDCTFCRRFHALIDQFNAKGITVNYVMLPRAGLNSSSYKKAVAVLCSSQPQTNMTLAMKDEFYGSDSCKHTVDKQLQLAREFGISSTPTMVLPNGEMKVGLITPEKLLALLN